MRNKTNYRLIMKVENNQVVDQYFVAEEKKNKTRINVLPILSNPIFEAIKQVAMKERQDNEKRNS